MTSLARSSWSDCDGCRLAVLAWSVLGGSYSDVAPARFLFRMLTLPPSMRLYTAVFTALYALRGSALMSVLAWLLMVRRASSNTLRIKPLHSFLHCRVRHHQLFQFLALLYQSVYLYVTFHIQ